MIDYSFRSQDYYETQQVDVDENCNSLTFINKGDTVLNACGVTLMPSPLNVGIGNRNAAESYTVGGNEGEVYKGSALVQFIAPIGANPCVAIIQKYSI